MRMLGILYSLAALAAMDAQDKNPAPIPGWNPDLAAGFQEAKASGKPLMIVFR